MAADGIDGRAVAAEQPAASAIKTITRVVT
jgi:hypothetical protein